VSGGFRPRRMTQGHRGTVTMEQSRYSSVPSLLDAYPPWGPRQVHRLPEGVASEPYKRFDLTPMTAVIGAEITGIDLATPLTDELHADVHRALLEWKVLVFVGQNLPSEGVHRFAAQWGEPYDAQLRPQGDVVTTVPVPAAGNQNYWHADDTYMARPGMGSVLRIVEVPAVGGDTVFADMGAAYDNLAPEMQARIDRLRAVHDCVPYALATPHYREHIAEIAARFPPVEHPVVRTHPESGRKTLFVNAMWTKRIVGLSPAESNGLLLRLCLQATVPEYQCRIRWTPDRVIFWDNRAVQHYAVSDYSEPRVMVRTTLRGDKPY